MSSQENGVNDPSGHAIAVFDHLDQGSAAKSALIEIGIPEAEIQIMDGRTQAAKIDDSAKWFADTDEILASFKEKLKQGATLVSAPVGDDAAVKQIQNIYHAAGAHTMTYFGTMLTRTVSLDHPETEKPITDK